MVFGRLPDLSGKAAIAAVLVDGGRNEVVLEERLRVISPHTVGTLRFLRCPTTTLHAPEIGTLGSGFEVAMQSLNLRPTVASACVGFARRALDEALVRCRERKAFGRPIAEHQMIQAKLAEMAVRINSASLLAYHAAFGAPIRRAQPQDLMLRSQNLLLPKQRPLSSTRQFRYSAV